MIKRFRFSLPLLCVIMSNASAAYVDFNLPGHASITGQPVGNTITLVVAGRQADFTAWSLLGNSNTTFQAAAFDIYQGSNLGGGVCNAVELALPAGCTGPLFHMVNSGPHGELQDAFLVSFQNSVYQFNLTVAPYDNLPTGHDRDVLIGYSNIPNLSLNGKSIANLTAAGMQFTQFTSGVSTQPITYTLNIPNGAKQILTTFGGPDTSEDDGKVNVGAYFAPEPMAGLMLGSGLMALVVNFRRQKHNL